MSMQLFECPRCGYHLDPTTKTETSYPQFQTLHESTASTHGEVSSLQAKARRLETLIEDLIQDRSALLSKINNIQATTRHLPAEILSSIFTFARPPINSITPSTSTYVDRDIEEENTNRVLASVCHAWRRVVLSTPRLWTTISLQISRESSISSIISLLDLYLERAGSLPITIELDFTAGVDPTDENEIKQLELYLEFLSFIEPLKTALLVERANKIQYLGLVKPPIEWLWLLNENLTQCTTVIVIDPMQQYPYIGDSLDFTTMPCLRRVDWVSHHCLPSLPDTITILHLRCVWFVVCCNSLMSYSNLVEFEMTDFHNYSSSMLNDQISGPLVFPQLKHFRWKPRSFVPAFLDFLRRAQFPNLHSLHWYYPPEVFRYDHYDYDPHLIFFSKLPPTLSSLTIFQFSASNQDSITLAFIRELLNCVPQVSKLHFDECLEPTVDILVNAIGRPLPTTLNSTQQYAYQSIADGDIGSLPRNKVLPHLRELVIGNLSRRDRKSSKIGLWKFGKMLKALRVTPGGNRESFRLVLDKRVKWRNDRKCLLHLRKVAMKSGFDLDISFDSSM